MQAPVALAVGSSGLYMQDPVGSGWRLQWTLAVGSSGLSMQAPVSYGWRLLLAQAGRSSWLWLETPAESGIKDFMSWSRPGGGGRAEGAAAHLYLACLLVEIDTK